VWQLEVDRSDWSSLEGEIMGGQGWTAGCNAVGGMEWQVLLLNVISEIFINLLRPRKSPAFPKLLTFEK
jgi:hypothetical protein